MEILTVKRQGEGYSVNGGQYQPVPSHRWYAEVEEWIAAGGVVEPEFTQAELDEQAAQAAKEAASTAKLVGVLFEGVMCSATAEDMWGLSSIKDWIVAGQSASFRFQNGNTLLITPANLDSFEAVWVPFRASFFK